MLMKSMKCSALLKIESFRIKGIQELMSEVKNDLAGISLRHLSCCKSGIRLCSVLRKAVRLQTARTKTTAKSNTSKAVQIPIKLIKNSKMTVKINPPSPPIIPANRPNPHGWDSKPVCFCKLPLYRATLQIQG